MTDQEREKRNFRNSKAWKDFRKNIQKQKRVDAITGKKLIKGYELHHLDLNPDHYKDLIPDNFLPCNKLTHKFIHWLYPYYIKDKTILDRLKSVLDKMKSINT